MDTSTNKHTFSEATKIRREDSVWKGHVHEGFSVGTVPNGGYLTSIIINALEADQLEKVKAKTDSKKDLINLTLFFLRPGLPGEDCEVEVEEIKRGKTTSVISCTFSQQNKFRIKGFAIFGNFQEANNSDIPKWVSKRIPIPSSSLSLKEYKAKRPEKMEGVAQSVERHIFSRYRWFLSDEEAKKLDSVFTKEKLKGFSDSMEDPGFLCYVSLEHDEDITPAVLGSIGDACIPCIKLLDPQNDLWVPSLQYNLQFYGPESDKGAPKKVLCRYITHSADNGFMLEDCDIVDAQSGKLLCCSRQSALAGGLGQKPATKSVTKNKL